DISWGVRPRCAVPPRPGDTDPRIPAFDATEPAVNEVGHFDAAQRVRVTHKHACVDFRTPVVRKSTHAPLAPEGDVGPDVSAAAAFSPAAPAAAARGGPGCAWGCARGDAPGTASRRSRASPSTRTAGCAGPACA